MKSTSVQSRRQSIGASYWRGEGKNVIFCDFAVIFYKVIQISLLLLSLFQRSNFENKLVLGYIRLPEDNTLWKLDAPCDRIFNPIALRHD